MIVPEYAVGRIEGIPGGNRTTGTGFVFDKGGIRNIDISLHRIESTAARTGNIVLKQGITDIQYRTAPPVNCPTA